MIGSPNVGKSSLLNALLGKERAIVTDIAGTTRDLIDEEMRLKDLVVRVTDTAGIRVSDDVIEQEGIRRSHKAASDADVVVLVLDATRSEQEPSITHPHLLKVWNKSDLARGGSPAVSAKTGEGIAELKELLYERLAPTSKEELLITEMRHKEALDRAELHLTTVIEGLAIVSPEFLTSDLRATLVELSRIIGKEITEEILTSIFNQFCIGK